jgi:hypothetical protein
MKLWLLCIIALVSVGCATTKIPVSNEMLVDATIERYKHKDTITDKVVVKPHNPREPAFICTKSWSRVSSSWTGWHCAPLRPTLE